MPTSATFYTDPLNIDYLIGELRIRYGDLTGDVYSDTVMRSALVGAVKYLEKRWASKYQVFRDEMVTSPQPPDVPAGSVAANTADGVAYIPATLNPGDVFRNPYIDFKAPSPPVITGVDDEAIVLAAKYILRLSKISSSADGFSSWRTEDIAYSNLGGERSYNKLIEADKSELDDYFKQNIAKPVKLSIPQLYTVYPYPYNY